MGAGDGGGPDWGGVNGKERPGQAGIHVTVKPTGWRQTPCRPWSERGPWVFHLES